MKSWKTAVLAAALVAAVGLGAALAPAAQGQARTRPATAPRAQVLTTLGGGSRIGVSISEVEAEDIKGKVNAGVVIDEVDEDSPASKAGLKKGDIVLEFDGERVRSVRQFTRLVGETPAGRTVSAAVMRDGQRVPVSITPREGGMFRYFEGGLDKNAFEALRKFEITPPPTPPKPMAPMTPKLERFFWSSGTRVGITMTDLSPQLAEYFGTKDGVLVSSVEPNSPAAKAGVKAGDVITTVNGNTVNDSSDVRSRLGRLDPGEEFSLGVMRDRRAMTLKGKLDTPSERKRSRTTL